MEPDLVYYPLWKIYYTVLKNLLCLSEKIPHAIVRLSIEQKDFSQPKMTAYLVYFADCPHLIIKLKI